jgi:hypothetical protein
MKKMLFLIFICILNISSYAQEFSLFKSFIAQKPILAGATLIGTVLYYDEQSIRNVCTRYHKKKITRTLSETKFSDPFTKKESILSAQEIERIVNSSFVHGFYEENYEFYDNNKQLIPPASPEIKNKDFVRLVSEIKIMQKVENSNETKITSFTKNADGEWHRKIVREIPDIDDVRYVDEKKVVKLIYMRKFVGTLGCACILLGSVKGLYNWLYPEN